MVSFFGHLNNEFFPFSRVLLHPPATHLSGIIPQNSAGSFLISKEELADDSGRSSGYGHMMCQVTIFTGELSVLAGNLKTKKKYVV